MTSQHRHQHEPINETTVTQSRANEHLPQVGTRIRLPRLLTFINYCLENLLRISGL